MDHDKLPHDHGQSADEVMEKCPSSDDFQKVSELLRQLRSADLIVSRREGKEVYYKAADNVQAAVFHRLIEEMLEISCPQPPQH